VETLEARALSRPDAVMGAEVGCQGGFSVHSGRVHKRWAAHHFRALRRLQPPLSLLRHQIRLCRWGEDKAGGAGRKTQGISVPANMPNRRRTFASANGGTAGALEFSGRLGGLHRNQWLPALGGIETFSRLALGHGHKVPGLGGEESQPLGKSQVSDRGG